MDREILIDQQAQIISVIQKQILEFPQYLWSVPEVMLNASRTLDALTTTLNKLEGNVFTMALSQATFDGLKSLIGNRNETQSALAQALATIAQLQQTIATKDSENAALVADLRAQIEAAFASNAEGNTQLSEIAELVRQEDEELAANNPPVEPSVPVEPPVEPVV